MLELAIKVSFVLGAALALAAALRGASAAWRHRVLAAGLVSALALPALSAVLPRWSVLAPVAIEATAPDLLPEVTAPAAPGAAPPPPSPAPAGSSFELDLGAVVIALWALGAAVLLIRLVGAHRAARALARRAAAVVRLEPGAAASAPGAGPIAAAARGAYAALGGRRRVRVAIAPVGGALTLGVLRPTVLLPSRAREWSAERLRLTLLHELAHVERADVAWLALAQLVRALLFWNPLAWLVARRLRREAELAADDRVLEAGARPSSYAEVLLGAACVGRLPGVAMGMPRRAEVEQRIVSVLASARRSSPRRAARLATLATAITLSGAVACAGARSAGPAAPEPVASADALDAIVREELAALVDAHAARSARALVLEVGTGRVLAMAAHGGDARAEMVRAIEIGSTVKPLTVAIALEQGFDPARTFFLEHGAWELEGGTLRDHADHGTLDVTGVLARSSNIGMGKIYLEVGAERVRAGLERLGLGRGPTLGVEGAEGGALPPLEAWNGFAGVTYAVGTALTATPLELTSAYAAIANDGVRIEPTLDGVAGAETRVLSAATARRVREMLVHAVEDEGATGRNARVSGLQVAGKTGTAMVEDDGVRALFVGIVPADAPRYVIYVDAEIGEDRPGFHGGSVAAPAFARIAARIAER